MDLDILKDKTGFVLNRLERALHSYTLENRKNANRSAKGGTTYTSDDPEEELYFKKVFEEFCACLETDDQQKKGNALLKSATENELFRIRNACQHVGRPYMPCYWYRVASIATHPLLVELGITDPIEAVKSAEEGTFDQVEHEWFLAYDLSVPNNLPDNADYDVTTFIGRREEQKELKKALLNPRTMTVSVTAPGGAGKTALAINVLRELAGDSTVVDTLDGIIFCTFKEEELTSSGVRAIEKHNKPKEVEWVLLQSANTVLETSYETLEEVVLAEMDKKFIILVDNAEGLIHEHESLLKDLESRLPSTWKLLFTSRINYEGGPAIPLKPMRDRDALHLARSYSKKRQVTLEEDQLGRLTEQCSFNPLAIKLSIDTIMAGGSITEAVSATNEKIAEYSFKNLMDALTSSDIQIFELINNGSLPTKTYICETLGLSEDEVQVSLRKLKQSSLLEQKITEEDENIWLVSEGVKLYASTNIRNIEERTTVNQLLHKQADKENALDAADRDQDFPPWHMHHVPSTLTIGLRALLSETKPFAGHIGKVRPNKHLMAKLPTLFTKFNDKKSLHKESPDFWLGFANIARCLELADAKTYFENALDLDNNSLKIRIGFVKYLHEQRQYLDGAELALKSIELANSLGPLERKEEAISILLYELLSLKLKAREFDFIDSYTKNWKALEGRSRITSGTLRAAALKRQSEPYQNDPDAALPLLRRACGILGQVIAWGGIEHLQAKEFFLIAKEFSRHSWHSLSSQETIGHAIYILNFCDEHLEDAACELRHQQAAKINQEELIAKLSRMQIDTNNPFQRDKWRLFLMRDEVGLELEEAAERYELGTVVAVEKKDSGFVFVEDDQGKSYFLHSSKIHPHDDSSAWNALQKGHLVAIEETGPSAKPGGRPSIEKAYYVKRKVES